MKRNLVRLLSVILSVTFVLTAFALPVNAADEDISILDLIDTQKTGISSENELLDYYKDKFSDIDYLYCADNNAVSEGVRNDMLCFSENIIAQEQVSTQQEKIVFPLSSSDLRTSYLLSTYKHSEDSGIHMLSSENGDSLAPALTVYCNDGTYTFPAAIDTYVRATGYSDNNQNETTAYGTADANNLWAMHCADKANNMPYSSNEMRTYILFDISELEGKIVQRAELSVYAEVKNPNSDNAPSSSTLPLVLMTPNYYIINESRFTWAMLKSLRAIGHYSWDGLDGFIFDETLYGSNFKNLGVPNSFLNAVSDFTLISALCKDRYFEKAKSCLLNFVIQTADTVNNGGFPASSSYEPARRLSEFPYIYKALLDNDMLTAQENSTVLKWLYKNTDYVYSEKSGELFLSGNTPNTSSDKYKSVEGFTHLSGLFNSFAFFDEFTAASSWETAFLSRFEVIINSHINQDGSYINASFDYPSSVINGFSQMLVYMNGRQYSGADSLKNKIYSLANYLIHCALPDGKLPEYGDNSGSDAASSVNQPIYSLCSDEASQNVLWYITNGEQGVEPEKYALYKNAKIATDRTGWSDNDSMIFTNAKSGGDYTHADSLALLMYAYGRNLLADTGNATADADLNAAVKSSTQAHNTVEVDSVSQSISDKDSTKDNINMYADNGASVIRAYTTSNENVTHYRNTAFIKALGGLTVVNDLLVPNDSASHTYAQNWHSIQDANVKTVSQLGSYNDNKWGYTDFASGANMMISQANDCVAETPYGLDAHSPSGYAPYMSFTKNGVGATSFNTAIYPYEGTNGGVHTVKLSTGVADSTASAMKIQTFSSTQLTEIENEIIYYNSFENNTTARNVTVSGNSYFTANAKNAFYNTDNTGNINMLFVSDGGLLDVFNGQNKIASVSADKTVSDLSVIYNSENMTVEIETSDNGVLNESTDVDIIMPENAEIQIKNVYVNGVQLSEYDNITVNGKTFKQYTVEFCNYDSTVLQSGLWFDGDIPKYNGETPVKEATAQYTYTFSDWEPEISAVSGNTVYTAQFSSTLNKYTVSFDANGGVCAAEPVSIGYGMPYGTLPSPEARTGFIFDGWYTEADGGEKITVDSVVTDNIVLYAHWKHDTFVFNESSTLLYNAETKIIYGLSASVTEDDLRSAFLNTNLSVRGVKGRIGTGILLELTDDNGDVYDTVTTVLFGDVNGDGLYDATDAMIVKFIAGGMLSKEQVGEAVYIASDCNHDGAIDDFDVELLEQAGILLASVDQSLSEEELLETSSAYVEYLNLIDQTDSTEERADNNFFNIIITLIKDFISFVIAFLTDIL